MPERFARVVREALIVPRARVRNARSSASDSARHHIFRDGGQTMAEYALVLGLVALVAAVSFATLGPPVAALVDSAADAF